MAPPSVVSKHANVVTTVATKVHYCTHCWRVSDDHANQRVAGMTIRFRRKVQRARFIPRHPAAGLWKHLSEWLHIWLVTLQVNTGHVFRRHPMKQAVLVSFHSWCYITANAIRSLQLQLWVFNKEPVQYIHLSNEDLISCPIHIHKWTIWHLVDVTLQCCHSFCLHTPSLVSTPSSGAVWDPWGHAGHGAAESRKIINNVQTQGKEWLIKKTDTYE